MSHASPSAKSKLFKSLLQPGETRMLAKDVTYGPLTYEVIPLGEVRWVDLVIDAGGDTISAYLVDDENCRRFRRGERFDHYGPGQVTHFAGPIRLPSARGLYLVIENPTKDIKTVSVGYHAM